MSLLLLIIVVVLVVVVGGVVLVAVLAAASSRKGSPQPMGYAPPPPAGYHGTSAGYSPYQARARVLSAPALAEVQTLLARGQKIHAIKLVREQTGMGLKDAKDYVDAMVGGGLAPALPEAVSWGQQPGGGLLSERARTFKAAGDLASAVALVRAETGMSQSEAERFINALD